jgi:beta-glucosidase
MTETYKDPSASIEARIDDLLSRMTPAEKIGQLNQMPPKPFGSMDALCEAVREGTVGTLINATSAYAGNEAQPAVAFENLNRVQKAAVEESRLGIPILFARDVIHGHRTGLPINIALAASFDMEAIEEGSAMAAREAAAEGIRWAFAPMVDVSRDGRWGRIVESAGEDPYLNGRVAEATVYGYQGREPEDLARPDKLAACLKHYIAYGLPEGGRDYDNVELCDNALRNAYLMPFAMGVGAGAATVMSGFHQVGAEPVTASRYLLTELLRGELGFDGPVISDYGAVQELIEHRRAEDRRHCAKLALEAGVDVDMCSGVYADHLEALVETGQVSGETLDRAVRRVLKVKFALGLFEKPYVDPRRAMSEQITDENRRLARNIAGKCIVLIKNHDNLLPLELGQKKLAVVGPAIDDASILLSTWRDSAKAGEASTIADAFRAADDQNRILYAREAEDIPSAVEQAELAVLCLGEQPSRIGENNSVADIRLPAGQEELIRQVAAMGKPVVLVLLCCRPIVLTDVLPFCDAVLYAFHGGTMGADALVDVITGRVNPSAKLPFTLPRHTGQTPIHYNRKSIGRPVRGARYKDVSRSPLLPFGFGLSYTTFEIANLRLDRSSIGPDEQIVATVDVTNTGSRKGTEVVQCYIQDCVSARTRPQRELKGFQRVELDPGQSSQVSFCLSSEHLGYYGPEGSWVVEPGTFRLCLGSSSTCDLETAFEVR